MKKSNVIGLTIGIVVVIVTVSLICWFAIKPVPTLIQGEVEVKSIKISSKLAGRIEQMDVKEGQQVKKGELLFVLSTPEVEAKLRQAEAARNAAGAQSAKASRGARIQEIEGALNMWKKAQAGVELAQKSFDRVKNLYESGVVPAQKYDEALANLKAMQTTKSAAKAQYDMAVEGPPRRPGGRRRAGRPGFGSRFRSGVLYFRCDAVFADRRRGVVGDRRKRRTNRVGLSGDYVAGYERSVDYF